MYVSSSLCKLLESLNLKDISLGEEGAASVLEAISTPSGGSHMKELSSLNLSCNDITAECLNGDDGLRLARALMLKPALRELHFEDNPLESEGVRAVVAALEMRRRAGLCAPVFLNLEGCECGPAGVDALLLWSRSLTREEREAVDLRLAGTELSITATQGEALRRAFPNTRFRAQYDVDSGMKEEEVEFANAGDVEDEEGAAEDEATLYGDMEAALRGEGLFNGGGGGGGGEEGEEDEQLLTALEMLEL